MINKFNYLLEKINSTEFSYKPFKHIVVENFFEKRDFDNIISSPEISSPKADTDLELINALEEKGFKSINFPGSVTNKLDYIKWHSDKKKILNSKKLNTSTEAFGYVLRLYNEKSLVLREINEFFSSDIFINAVLNRFNLNNNVTYDGGIQKYLDGYEISPHPDIRKKALTWMININSFGNSEELDMHTHYLSFKKEREYVKKFWEGNLSIERAWLPWNWAKTVFQQVKNNSIVIFSPNNDTLHAVKANYNHLLCQRTQVYGNLWYNETYTEYGLAWEELDILSKTHKLKERTDKGQGNRNI